MNEWKKLSVTELKRLVKSRSGRIAELEVEIGVLKSLINQKAESGDLGKFTPKITTEKPKMESKPKINTEKPKNEERKHKISSENPQNNPIGADSAERENPKPENNNLDELDL